MRTWQCETCGEVYGEYVNGCPKCWHGDSSNGCITHEPNVRSKIISVEVAEECGAKDGRRARNGGYSMACVKPKGHDGKHEDCCGCWWQ